MNHISFEAWSILVPGCMVLRLCCPIKVNVKGSHFFLITMTLIEMGIYRRSMNSRWLRAQFNWCFQTVSEP